MKFDLNVLREIYNNNENLMEYMKKESGNLRNTLESIMLSYDIQAGTYVEHYKKNPKKKDEFICRLSNLITEKKITGNLLEAGVGEATSLVPLLNSLPDCQFQEIYAFDISWSRIKVAKEFCFNQNKPNIKLFTGDLFNIPLVDNYFDLVYTVHAIEPNGSKEKEILQELYRVCKQYLILLEPAYEFANEAAKKRMLKNGYITNLYQSARELNFDVEKYELYGLSENDLNPTGIMIIKKKIKEEELTTSNAYACPISKKPLNCYHDSFYCPDSMLAYPIIQGIPCLTTSNAVVATKY